ncbi:MAG: hypothetical protein LBM98_01415 [Oscillospiraceae bacterium]|nr:hypothetical protein [Oscillospiraceae bacterium]
MGLVGAGRTPAPSLRAAPSFPSPVPPSKSTSTRRAPSRRTTPKRGIERERAGFKPALALRLKQYLRRQTLYL